MYSSLKSWFQNSNLHLIAARYHLNGSLISVSELKPVELQLCPGLWNGIESAFRFGARYFHTCNLPAKQLIKLGTAEPIFYDLYLQYDDGKKNMLYAIPLLVRNIKVGTTYPNVVSCWYYCLAIIYYLNTYWLKQLYIYN